MSFPGETRGGVSTLWQQLQRQPKTQVNAAASRTYRCRSVPLCLVQVWGFIRPMQRGLRAKPTYRLSNRALALYRPLLRQHLRALKLSPNHTPSLCQRRRRSALRPRSPSTHAGAGCTTSTKTYAALPAPLVRP